MYKFGTSVFTKQNKMKRILFNTGFQIIHGKIRDKNKFKKTDSLYINSLPMVNEYTWYKHDS